MLTNVRTWLYRAFAAAASLVALLLASTLIRRQRTQQQTKDALQAANQSLSQSRATTIQLQTLEERDVALLDALRVADDKQAAAERARINEGLSHEEVRRRLHERGITSER